MKTLQTQYNLIKEGKGDKAYFMKLARYNFPDLVTPVLSYKDTITVLKNKSILSEGIGGLVTTGRKQDWHAIFKENINENMDLESAKAEAQKISKEEGVAQHVNMRGNGYEVSDWYDSDKTVASYENGRMLNEAKVGDTLKHKSTGAEFKITKMSGNDIEGKYTKLGGMEGKVKVGDTNKTNKNLIGKTYELISEAKAIEKETTKEVTDMATRGYDYKDPKNYDNVFGEEFLKGFYTEMGDSKNEGKTVEELRAIVAKNLAKDISHYVKDGQFGVKGVGYQTEAPGLGTPKEAKGKHKSSGYGDLKESVLRAFISEMVKEVLAETSEKEFTKATNMIDAGKSVEAVAKMFPNISKSQLQKYKDEKEGLESGDLDENKK